MHKIYRQTVTRRRCTDLAVGRKYRILWSDQPFCDRQVVYEISQYYFRLDPVSLRRGAERTLSRVFGLPPERVRVNAKTLREDFRLDKASGEALVQSFAADGLLQEEPGNTGNYQLTERFHESAQARVIAPLDRTQAKQLIDKPADWLHTSMPIAPGIR